MLCAGMTLDEILTADSLICSLVPHEPAPREALMHLLRWWRDGAKPMPPMVWVTTTHYTSTCSYWLRKLEAADYIENVPHRVGKHASMLRLTDAGERYCETLAARFVSEQQRRRSMTMTRELREMGLA